MDTELDTLPAREHDISDRHIESGHLEFSSKFVNRECVMCINSSASIYTGKFQEFHSWSYFCPNCIPLRHMWNWCRACLTPMYISHDSWKWMRQMNGHHEMERKRNGHKKGTANCCTSLLISKIVPTKDAMGVLVVTSLLFLFMDMFFNEKMFKT